MNYLLLQLFKFVSICYYRISLIGLCFFVLEDLKFRTHSFKYLSQDDTSRQVDKTSFEFTFKIIYIFELRGS